MLIAQYKNKLKKIKKRNQRFCFMFSAVQSDSLLLSFLLSSLLSLQSAVGSLGGDTLEAEVLLFR